MHNTTDVNGRVLGTVHRSLQAKIMEALEKTKSNPKAKDDTLEIKGFINSVKGLLTYQLEIIPTVAEV